jgi:peptide/nickel transport system permease protein
MESTTALVQAMPKGKSLWKHAWIRLKKEKLALFCLGIVAAYTIVALLAKLELIASPWDEVVGASYQAPSFDHYKLWFGTDIFGRSVLFKVIHGTRIAMSVGLVTALIAVPIGAIVGALAGYFGGVVDEIFTWFYSVISSVPNLLLLIAISYAVGKGMMGVYISLSATAWIGLARVIRGEFMKHKHREYVVAAESIGATQMSRIFKHIFPNVAHFMILNLSMQFMSAIKSEVILSFLGLGVQGQPSWGIMIDDAKLELARGVWWQLTAATVAMTIVILALNIVGDALRDALDPKIK